MNQNEPDIIAEVIDKSKVLARAFMDDFFHVEL